MCVFWKFCVFESYGKYIVIIKYNYIVEKNVYVIFM